MPTVRTLQGHVLDRLRDLPDNSVHCVVTSPPYWGLRSYLPTDHPLKKYEIGMEKTPAEYIAKMTEIFREVRRVLRPDGTCWVNLGDCYATGGGPQGERFKDTNGTKAQNPRDLKARILAGMRERKTVGWQKTCKCETDKRKPCVVLDPFGGSGTTGQVAIEEGRDAILIELNPEYIPLIEKRISPITPGLMI